MAKTNGYLEDMHERWISPKTRELYIHGVDSSVGGEYDGEEPGVEYMMANKVIKNLHYLLHQSKTEPVTIHMHTCGGMWEEGMAIYDTIKAMPYHVTIISYTHARSMSSIILQAADERVLLPNSYFLIHYGSEHVVGATQEVYSNIAYSKYCCEVMLDIYVEVCYDSPKFKGKTEKQVRSHLKNRMLKEIDVFIKPKDAIEYGFADKILEKF